MLPDVESMANYQNGPSKARSRWHWKLPVNGLSLGNGSGNPACGRPQPTGSRNHESMLLTRVCEDLTAYPDPREKLDRANGGLCRYNR